MNVQCWVFSCRGLSWRMRMVVYSLISPYCQCFALFLLALWPMFLISFLLGFFHSSETVRALYLVVGSFSLLFFRLFYFLEDIFLFQGCEFVLYYFSFWESIIMVLGVVSRTLSLNVGVDVALWYLATSAGFRKIHFLLGYSYVLFLYQVVSKINKEILLYNQCRISKLKTLL